MFERGLKHRKYNYGYYKKSNHHNRESGLAIIGLTFFLDKNMRSIGRTFELNAALLFKVSLKARQDFAMIKSYITNITCDEAADKGFSRQSIIVVGLKGV